LIQEPIVLEEFKQEEILEIAQNFEPDVQEQDAP
jgi:hypothetical protein